MDHGHTRAQTFSPGVLEFGASGFGNQLPWVGVSGQAQAEVRESDLAKYPNHGRNILQ